MLALTQELEVTGTLPDSEHHFLDQVQDWRTEIEFMGKEKDFFLFLLNQSAEYSHLNDDVKFKLMAESMVQFASSRILPFAEQLLRHQKKLRSNLLAGELRESNVKKHRSLQRQFRAIQETFRSYKEKTFENAEDLMEVKII